MTSHDYKKPYSRFSPRVYGAIVASLSLIGLFASCYLALSHYRNYSDLGYQSFCAISRSLNCDTVSQSPYAIVMGVPVAVWGIVGYSFLLCMVVLLHQASWRWWRTLFLLSALYSLASVLLAAISAYKIHSYCLVCLLTYIVNFMLLFFSWLAARRFGVGPLVMQLKSELAFFQEKSGSMIRLGIVFVALVLALAFFLPNYWRFPELSTEARIASGVTADGSPWIGAQHPVLTITEFTDYMCFQCGKMHSYLRKLVNRYPDRIRLVHRHFPLDKMVNPFLQEQVHANSGLVSLFAIAAQKQGVFWKVNDLLLKEIRESKKINFSEIGKQVNFDMARFVNVINDKENIAKLEKDLRDGLKLKISATPSYLINGIVYVGSIPEYILKEVMTES